MRSRTCLQMIQSRFTPSLKGWNTNLTGIRSKTDFPAELNDYIAFLEQELKVPVTFVSVGPDREQIISMK